MADVFISCGGATSLGPPSQMGEPQVQPHLPRFPGKTARYACRKEEAVPPLPPPPPTPQRVLSRQVRLGKGPLNTGDTTQRASLWAAGMGVAMKPGLEHQSGTHGVTQSLRLSFGGKPPRPT